MDEKMLRYDAEKVLEDELFQNEFTLAAAKFIIEKTNPLTIRESGWNEKEHRLSGATNRVGDDVVMLRGRDSDFGSSGEYLIVCVDGDYNPDALTPNGKKYELREVPEHPEYLETEEDYGSAPDGTILADYERIWERKDGKWLSSNLNGHPIFLPGTSRRVLRWGDEE